MAEGREARHRLAGEVAGRSAPSLAFAGAVRALLRLSFPCSYAHKSAIATAEATARFPDVQLNRARSSLRSTRLKGSCGMARKSRHRILYDGSDNSAKRVLARCPPADVGCWHKCEVPAASSKVRLAPFRPADRH